MGILPLSKKSKWALIILLPLLGIYLFYQLLRWFAPGSYPFSEIYEFNVGENELINAVEEFKMEKPEYRPPLDGLIDGRRDTTDYWYHAYFYYSDENKILKCWIRGRGTKYSRLGFVGINDGIVLSNWKLVNDDYGFFENRRVIKQFEDRILSGVKKKLKLSP